MQITTFWRGVGVGMVTGVVVGVMMPPHPKARKTTVGQAMQRMGNAVDAAIDTVTGMMK